jgi:hypothetical protein
MSNRLDDDSLRFQAEAEALVRKWARDDPREYWRRWRQFGNWSMNRTQGDAVKRTALKKRLMGTTGGHCADCQQVFEPAALQMHRLEQSHAHDRSRNFGYFEGNVLLLCAPCHEGREATRR